MEKPNIKFGLYYALIYLLGTLAIYLVKPEALFMMYTGWFWMALLLAAMILATRAEKLKYPDQFSFRQGFTQSWLTYAIGTITTMIFYHILVNYVDPGLLDLQKEAQIEGVEKMAKWMSLSEDNIEKQIEVIKNQEGPSPGKLFFGFALSLVLGAIPAIVVAAIFKKSPTLKSPM